MQQTIEIAFDQICEMAESNPSKHNIESAIGEVMIDGHNYQVTLSLLADKTRWADKGAGRYIEVVKYHD